MCRSKSFPRPRVEKLACIKDRVSCFGDLIHNVPVHGGGRIEDSPLINDDAFIGWVSTIRGNVVIPAKTVVPDSQSVGPGHALLVAKSPGQDTRSM